MSMDKECFKNQGGFFVPNGNEKAAIFCILRKGAESMREMYRCPECGRELRCKGLCWSCKAEQERREMLAWTPEQVREKLEALTADLTRLEEDAWDKDFWALLGYHNAITPELQRAALERELYYPGEIYY